MYTHPSVDSSVKLFFTEDEKFLKQYYFLRQEAYRLQYNWPNFDGSECDFDHWGRILVAVKDGVVIGGLRLMFSDRSKYLANEIPGTQFEYEKLIRKYDNRENIVIAEISGMVVAKEYRDNSVMQALFAIAFEESKREKCHYVFSIALIVVCRRDRRTLRKLGYDLEIVINYPWKERKIYNYAPTFPVYVKLG